MWSGSPFLMLFIDQNLMAALIRSAKDGVVVGVKNMI